MNPGGFRPGSSDQESEARDRLARLLSESPLSSRQLVDSLLLYARRQLITEVLTSDWLYRRILQIPGVVMELGCRFGPRLAVYAGLRGALEPFNVHRRIIGFDTFTGFPDTSPEDGEGEVLRAAAFEAPVGYAGYLQDVLDTLSIESPLSHLRRIEVVSGDVRHSLPSWLNSNPEALIALAYFDMDLYAPTVAAIDALRPRLVRGSILAFDQLAHPDWPGETRAVVERLGLGGRTWLRPRGMASPTCTVW